MSRFCHLHLHTEYSLLDGATRISSIADKAISDGQTAVAITDHGAMYGAVEFYDALKKKGIKPIIGCEVYVAQRSRFSKEGKQDSSGNHMILLCKNVTGYKNLCYMVSESYINGFYMRPRIDMELLRSYHEGLICLTGCVAGKIPQLILAGSMPEAINYAKELKQLFCDDLYLEIQNHGIDEEKRVAFGIRQISRELSIPMVATNDVHYLNRTDADNQAVLMCIQTGSVITDGRPLGFENNEFYFKTEKEMTALFSDFEGAVENTAEIADKCCFDFEFGNLHLPDFRAEDGSSHKDTLRHNALVGFEERAREGRFDFEAHTREYYLERMEYELSVIDRMGFNAYFLIVSDFVSYAKKNDIPVGPGRGSGAGSLVAFCVGITDVDPIKFDLLFERFLNPERVSMPDFDIDFCYNRREEVIDYVKRKYGDDKVAQIATFGTLAARAAIRDVGRALGMQYAKVDAVAKLVPQALGITIDKALESKELKQLYDGDPDVRKLINISRSLEGMPRHMSTHAAGVVITECPTYEYVPLSYSGTGVVTQFDMVTDERLGLVKFDFLGLRYITVLQDAQMQIRRHTPTFDLSKIPFDDKETFKLLCDAKTDGVFQLESAGMKQVLSRLAPSNLEDVIAVIALFRPGPMDSIDSFIERKHGREAITYKTPLLEKILDVTYGCIVYQEQVMQICRTLAGYTYAEADLVRRAMAKKKAEVMNAERVRFVAGCLKNNIDESVANSIFDSMVAFAQYAFNKSHATAYSIISYRTAYLKAHYPKEYFAALMTSVLDSQDKLRQYIQDAAKHGVRVLAPDINLSGSDFSVADGDIRFGLLAIKNVGRNVTESIIREREKGKFTSFDTFITRLSGSDINKRTLEAFIKCGVFDSLGITRASLLACYEQILDSEQTKQRNNIKGQMDFFSEASFSDEATGGFTYPDLPEFSPRELLMLEKESSGMYFTGNILSSYSRALEALYPDSIAEITESVKTEDDGARYKDGNFVKIGGIISSKKNKILKNGDTMAFITLEDSLGEIEVIVFSKQFARYQNDLKEENAVLIEGKISVEDNNEPKILLSRLTNLKTNSEYVEEVSTKAESTLYIKLEAFDTARLNPIYRLAALYPGVCRVVIYDAKQKKYIAIKNVSINPCDEVVSRLKSYFGDSSVVLR